MAACLNMGLEFIPILWEKKRRPSHMTDFPDGLSDFRQPQPPTAANYSLTVTSLRLSQETARNPGYRLQLQPKTEGTD